MTTNKVTDTFSCSDFPATPFDIIDRHTKHNVNGEF